MIQISLVDVVKPLRTTINALANNTEVCEHNQRATIEIMALKDSIVKLRKDVNYLKSTNISIFFGIVEIPYVPKVPLNTTIYKGKMEKEVCHNKK